MFGRSEVFLDLPQQDTRLLRIDREDFFDILADHIQVTQGVLKALVTRLRGLVERVR